jgi:hypothetical protein
MNFRISQGCAPPFRGSRGRAIPCLSQFLVAADIPWLVTAFFPSLPPGSHCLLCQISFGIPLIKSPVTSFGAHPNNLGYLPNSQSLITSVKIFSSWAPVAHPCNPSYSGGRAQEDLSSKSAQADSSRDPTLKKCFTKKGWLEWLKV